MTKRQAISPALVVVLLLTTRVAISTELPEAVHGGIALIPIESFEPVHSVSFQDSDQLIAERHAIVAVPLFTDPGVYDAVVLHGNNQTSTAQFRVTQKQYPEEHITIADQELVSPSQTNLDRISRESQLMREAYARFSEQPAELLPLIQPVEGRNSGVFGSRRFFNGQPRNPHSGIDWAAPTGTPIKNPAPGVVAVTGEFFFNGNTVMVDHGGGFISMMCHLDSIAVSEGQHIDRGSVLGTVGTTGRSTGPHLHWTVSLNGVRTDPDVFMRVLEQLK